MRRPIRDEERDLIRHLLAQLPSSGNAYVIPDDVGDLRDGGMGSLQLSCNGTHAGELIVQQYTDADGILVLIGLSVNQLGELFDLDFWKVDFSPLRAFPKPEQLKMVR